MYSLRPPVGAIVFENGDLVKRYLQNNDASSYNVLSISQRRPAIIQRVLKSLESGRGGYKRVKCFERGRVELSRKVS